MNKQAENEKQNKQSSNSNTGSEHNTVSLAEGDRPANSVPEAGSRETSDKEALNGVSPKSSPITGDGEGLNTTKANSAKAASANQDKGSKSEDRSGRRSDPTQ